MKRRPTSKRISRADGSGSTLLKLAVPLFLVGVVVLAGPSNLFTALTLPRGSSSDVVSDPSSVVGLDTTHVGAGTNRELTTITNQFQQSITVTVSLTGDSVDQATLYADGINHGDTVTFDSVASGANVSVNASVKCKDSLVGQSITYDIEATGAGINGTIQDRSVPIEQYCLT